MSLLLKNTTYIDWQSLEFIETDILVEEGEKGTIRFVEQTESLNDDPAIIDCSGKFVTKSFTVGHHHVYSALARGMPAPQETPKNFYEILKYIWWNLDKALDKDTIEASALATAIACAKAGSTFVIDHHASPNYIDGSLEIIAKTFEKVGVSHLLCYEITDRDGLDKSKKGLTESEQYLQKHQGLVGLHASFTVSEEIFKNAVKLMEKYHTGIHIHVAEDLYDQQFCQDNYGKRVVERLNDHGVLNSTKTILAHCLHINDTERDLIANSKTWIVENMESNLKNKVGYFNGEGLGERIMLGTDGMHSDMLRSTRAAYFVGQKFDNIDFESAYQRFRNVHHYLDSNNFSGDGENNLVVLDYPSPTPVTKENFHGHFIFGLTSNDVQHVISNGKLIVKDKTVQTIDENEILAFTREQAARLWKRMSR